MARFFTGVLLLVLLQCTAGVRDEEAEEGVRDDARDEEKDEDGIGVETKARTALSDHLAAQRLFKQFGAPEECEAVKMCKESCIANVNKLTTVPNFQMKVFHNDKYISWPPLCNGMTWEWHAVSDLINLIGTTQRGTFLDIGANLGSWTLPIAATKRKVIAVEVSAVVSGALQESVELNHFEERVSVNRFAVVQDSSHTKHVCQLATDEALSTSQNIGGNQVNLGNRRDICAEEVPSLTLDELYGRNLGMQEVVAAKLDCEGCEGQALLGADNFLSTHPPCFLAMEVTEAYLCQAGTPLVSIKEFLAQKGYDVSSMTSVADGTCEGYQQWLSSQPSGTIAQSFVTIPQQSLETCLARFLDK